MIRAISLEDARNDRTAEFEELALPHLDSLYRTALRLTRSEQDAEDLVQDTYLRAFRAFDSFQEGTNCRAWLYKILTNSNINRFRKAVASPERVNFDDVKPFVASPQEPETASAADTEALGEILDDELKAALETVPESFRTPVLLSSVEGLSYQEIARVLDCPIGTVMSRIFRGRRILREALADYARERGYREACA
jgi:RNA polymerase sigma-70 factor (ECF subfamily)